MRRGGPVRPKGTSEATRVDPERLTDLQRERFTKWDRIATAYADAEKRFRGSSSTSTSEPAHDGGER